MADAQISMLNRDEVALIVIDVQDKLLPTINGKDILLERIVSLIRFARELAIPVLATEQYPKGLGATTASVSDALEHPPLEKMAFSCMGEPNFVSALESLGRRQLLVIGIETHVCVMQTCLMALKKGYEVFLPVDAVGAHNKRHHETALQRMASSGVTMATAEMTMFEALKVAGTPDFKKILPLIK